MRINEKLGVPEGLNQEAENLYKKLIKSLSRFILSSREIPTLDDENTTSSIILARYDIRIQKLHLKRVPFKLNFNYKKDIDKPYLLSAGFIPKYFYKYKDSKIYSESDIEKSGLSLTIVINNNQTKLDLVDLIKEKLDVETISHELMHLFDYYKNNKRGILKKSEYISYTSNKDNFPKSIRDFLFLLYYTSSFENTVRPTELYHQMLKNKVKKSEFLNFMKDNEIIKLLKKAEYFSINDFKKELNADDEVKEYVDKITKDGYIRIGEYADDMLNLLMINLIEGNLKNIDSSLDSYVSEEGSLDILISEIVGKPTDKVIELNKRRSEFFDKMSKNYKKYEGNHHKYFEDVVKGINFTGRKMKIKLYKLYDMIHTDNTFTKINKNERFILDFNSFNNK